MLKKALTYCLQDDDPVRISDLIGVKEYQKQPKLTQSTFVTSSDLKQMIINQRNDNRAQSYCKIRQKEMNLKPLKITAINRTFDCKIPVTELCRGRKRLNFAQNQEHIKPRLYFGSKQQQFKVKIDLREFRLEDMF